jgi:hypothetical protein
VIILRLQYACICILNNNITESDRANAAPTYGELERRLAEEQAQVKDLKELMRSLQVKNDEVS